MLAFQLSIQLLLLIAVGVLVWRLGLLDKKFDQSLAALVLNVCLPCMIVRSFCTDYDPNQLKNCVVLVGLSVALMCLWFGVGQLVFRLHKRSFTGRILRFGAMFSVGDPARAGRLLWQAKKKVLELHLTEDGRGLFGEVAQARFAALALALKATTKVEELA